MAEKREREELLQRAMRLCSEREYCINDILTLVGKWGSPSEEDREWILEKLVAGKFIDENRYSRAFVIDHFRYNHWGRIKISLALRGKKIKESVIASALEAIDEDEYLSLLTKIINDQLKKVKGRNRAELKGKLLRHALGKGFESSLVYDTINSLFSDRHS